MNSSCRKKAIVIFTRNELANNFKIFRSKKTYDLFNNKIEEVAAKVKNEIEVDTILCSDDPDLIRADLFIEQEGRTFGEKFNIAVKNSFRLGYDDLIIIGNDSPELSAQHLIESFINLSREKVVIGPSYDGGIYLLGLTKSLFTSEIKARWNTGKVQNDLIKLYSDNEIVLLEHLYDIDSEKDLISWLATKSHSAVLFQKLLTGITSVKQKKCSVINKHSTEQDTIRIHTQKAPPHLISFS